MQIILAHVCHPLYTKSFGIRAGDNHSYVYFKNEDSSILSFNMDGEDTAKAMVALFHTISMLIYDYANIVIEKMAREADDV